MRRLLIAALSALALSACMTERPIRDRLTLDFTPDDEAKRVRVVAETTFVDFPGRPPRALGARLDAAREAIINGHDDWGVRFAKVAPENERVIFDRKRGTIERVEHSALIDRDDLHKLFADLPVTVQLTHGEGWSELAIYPASSTRATREQREHFDRTMRFWTKAVAHYFAAMHATYEYLDAHPRRAEIVFAALVGNDPNLVLLEEEEALVNEAGDAVSDVTSRVEAVEDQAYTLTEEADLLYQPLAADLVVKLPRTILDVEGFERHEGTVTMTRPSLLDAVSAVEGRWLDPDPLVMRMREKTIDIAELAARPRHSVDVVTASDIEDAVLAQLKTATSYRVRWRD